MARQVEKFEVETTRRVFDATTGERADVRLREALYGTDAEGLSSAKCGNACLARVLRRNGLIVTQCFPEDFNTLEAAEAQEVLCAQTQEQSVEQHISGLATDPAVS